MTLYTKIQFRRDTTAAWASANPTLAEGEVGLETDGATRVRVGDGATAWNTLSDRARRFPTISGEVGVLNDFFEVGDLRRYGYDVSPFYDATQAAANFVAVRSAVSTFYATNNTVTPPSGYPIVVPPGDGWFDSGVFLGSVTTDPRALLLSGLGARWLFRSGVAGGICVDAANIHGGSKLWLPAIATDPDSVLSSNSATWPRVGLFRARKGAAGTAQNTFHGLTIYGYFSLANYYNYAAEVDNYWDARIDNLATTPHAYCWYVTDTNQRWAVQSSFLSITTTRRSTQGHYVYRARMANAIDALGAYPGSRASQWDAGAYVRIEGVDRLVMNDVVFESARESVTYPCVWLGKEASGLQCSSVAFDNMRGSDADEYRALFRLGANVARLHLGRPTVASGAYAIVKADPDVTITGVDGALLQTAGITYGFDCSAQSVVVQDINVRCYLPSRFGYRMYGRIDAQIAAAPVLVTLTASAVSNEEASNTTLSVDTLLGDIPSNVVLNFGAGKEARTRVAASSGDTQLVCRGLPLDLASGNTAMYRTGVVFDSPVQVAGDGAVYAELATNGAVGDSNYTAIVGASPKTLRFNQTLTSVRTVSLDTAALTAFQGAAFDIIRTGSGAPALDVGGLRLLAQNGWCRVEFSGSAWFVASAGTL